MYYPYLRGRQNELLCLRELLEKDKLSKKVIPVIEPVRWSSTFFSTIKKFVEKDREIIIIKNPEVGSFLKEYREKIGKIEELEPSDKKEKQKKIVEEYKELLKDSHIISAYINNSKFLQRIDDASIDLANKYVINKNRGDFRSYEEYGEALEAKVAFIPNSFDFLDVVESDKVLLEDCFTKARRNVDYIENEVEFFSKNHLVYKKRGYDGFSDYSIVGDEYEESGFAPLAVAIHVVYFNEKNDLMVRHFVSDSNENISDPGGKFGEAVEKLAKWVEAGNVKKTEGLKELLNYYKSGKFPGLGVIKKLSIKHHIELIGDFEENE